MLTFADAFAQAYNAGLHRRWLDEREERERQLKEQTGEAMKAAYLDAVMQPYQKRADDFSQNAVGTFNANNSIIAEALLGGTEAPDAQTAVQKFGASLEAGRQPIAAALDSATQRANAAQKMRGDAFLLALPTLLSLEQRMQKQYKQSDSERKAQAAIAKFQNAQTLDEKKAAALEYQFATGKSIDSHFYTPQYKEVPQGGTLIDPATGRVIYAAPAKPEKGEQVKLANGNLGLLYSDGSIRDTGQKFYVEPKVTEERYVDTPLGKLPISKFMDIYKDAAGGETYSERPDPYDPTKTIRTKNIKPPKQDVLMWAQPIYDRLNGGGQSSGNGRVVDYSDAIMKITAALNKNAAVDANNRWNKKQFEDYIGQQFGDLAPYLIRDVNWANWGM
jgi:hypothetical protein